MTATSPLLHTVGLSKSFKHEGQMIHVLREVDLSIYPGEQIAVVGRSGAGKSTLLHVLGTLDAPTSGKIIVDDKDVSSLSSKALAAFRNETIGFIFQFHHLLPEFTAVENVMLPGLIRRWTKKKARVEAERFLEEVGLSHRLTHRPGELSGGEQQRVALARALVSRPKLLLADEPTGNLDSNTSNEIHALFDRLNAEHGTAMLVVTHSQELARRMPRRLRMSDGRLLDETADPTEEPPTPEEAGA
ncbi:MAG: ABC transporter ATP-binding protein [Bradymonadia bacterium]